MKTYLCSYSVGHYDWYEVRPIFVTNDLEKAKQWVNRMNKLIPKVYIHESKKSIPFRRTKFRDYNEAYYEEIDFR